MDFDGIAEKVKLAQNMPKDRQIDLWEQLLDSNPADGMPDTELPFEAMLMKTDEFKMQLAHDRNFCRRAGIPYAKMDEYWDQIRAGVALYCIDKYMRDKQE